MTNPAELRWQIKLPDATFELIPAHYDPEQVEFSTQAVLESDRDDKIQVVLERKTEGKQIVVRVLELEGKDELDSVRISISQGQSGQLAQTRQGEPATFEIADPMRSIQIRLFTS